ncbi:SusC/RagA family TonB-linked outer membrane protein [Adhaeribacter aerolatus]|uniref:SusC/RagA family TonB-linked outer membrane protein n=1 Tax=Adhaeribacter aerolatus TaxID=670289 RepID=A0A512ASP1_9BACT|nr:SusC/RagA family TonB-linked outer membrane protein [Adhaeribacter aerolatus]
MQEALAQNRTITGRVTDASNNEGLPGVTVLVKGTQIGATTNVTGDYSISVPAGSTALVFSFVGYTSAERAIGNATTINLAMQVDAKQLGEVVVTALGITREKRDLGYAATSVTEEVVTRANPVNVATGLQGKVAGLNVMTTNSGVFENVRINLRGIRSITGNNNPLLVIDGVQSDLNYLSSINPNDIENVSVLKGASAAAIYGPDARNGVIVVTTKKGAANDNPVVTLSNSTQFQQVSFFPKFQTQFGSGGYGVYTAYENWSWGPAFDGSEVPIGKVLPDGTTQMVKYSPRNDRKEFFNTGVVMQNDVSLAAKDFYISLQDANIKGVVPDDKNRRTGIRLNTGREYGKFKVGLNTNYIQQNYNVYNAELQDEHFTKLNTGSNEGLMNLIFNTPAHIPLTSYKDFRNNPYAQFNNYFNDYGLNPYWAIDNWRLNGKREDILTNLDLNFKATDWLSFTYRAGLIARFINERGTSAGETPNEYGLGRSFDIITGSVEERSYRNTRLSSEAFANFNKQITKDIRVTGILGTYVRQDDARDTEVGAGTLVVPELFNISNLAGQLSGTSPQSRARLFSVYASAGFNYKGWANLELTGRQDRTSVLNMNNNSYFYPGVSASLVVSDLVGILRDNSTVSFVKLRGSWNKTANADIAPYSLAGTFKQMYGFPYGNLAGFTANNTTYDANLNPEFIRSVEFGIETGFLNNRLSVEATYYNQDNTDQIIPIRVSEATGFGFANVNAASFVNKGVELEARLTPLVNLGGVNINFNANATYSDSEIKSIFEDLDQIAIGGYTIASNYAIVGQPAFILQANDYLRDDQGRIIVDKYSGYPTEDPTLKPFGRTLPKWIVGLNPSVNWKGLNLSVLAEYKGGHVAYHGIGPGMAWTGVSAATARNNRERFVIPNSVIENEDGSFTPNTNIAITNPNDFYIGVYRDVFSNFVTSAASWRLREVALSYTLPASILARQKVIKGISVAVTGRNLALWLPKTNEFSDPDFSSFGAAQPGVSASTAYSSNTFGITSSQINPPVRIFGGNVTLTF